MTGEVKRADSDADIRRCFPVMKALRPHLRDEADLLERARRQMRQSGWRLVYVEDGNIPVACASFRISEYLAWGKTIYVDDLIVLESHRGRGFAAALMDWIAALGEAEGCDALHLDSGTALLPAHRFYHRWGLSITSFHFAKKLGDGRRS